MYNLIPKFVDLDLPSGLLWAECNVGATKPSETGKYFQWGDVYGRYGSEIKEKICNWETTPWGKNEPPIKTLDAEHDAAIAAYGEGYRMPTKNEIKELFDNTIKQIVYNFNDSCVNGCKFISKLNPNKYIFIPFAGYCIYNNNKNVGRLLCIWSSSLANCTTSAFSLYCQENCEYDEGVYYCSHYDDYRICGNNVRAVKSK